VLLYISIHEYYLYNYIGPLALFFYGDVSVRVAYKYIQCPIRHNIIR